MAQPIRWQNQLDDEALRGIVARSSTVWERMAGQFEHATGLADTGPLLERWRQVAAAGSRSGFAKRLGRDGVTIEQARRAVGPVVLPVDADIPVWATRIAELLARSGTIRRDPAYLFDPDTPRPFEDVLAPLVVAASAEVSERSADLRDRWSDGARTDMDRGLLASVCRACSECLYQEFDAYRATTTTSFGRLLARTATPPPREVYSRFLQDMHAGGFASLLATYPVLARMLSGLIHDWQRSIIEFAERFAADHAEIVATLFGGHDPGPLVGWQGNLSDPHRGGRATMLLVFANGTRLIYKPRSLEPERAWGHVLEWVNERVEPASLRVVPLLDRPGYGWVTFVDHLPCPDPASAQQSFYRSGLLLALVYILGGNDCHFENVIASGDQPVLVDLETIMHPVRAAADPDGLEAAVATERLESVIRTGMLPQWASQSGGRAVDISALGAIDGAETSRAVPQWTSIGTDIMEREYRHISVPPGTNVVWLDGAIVSPNAYVDDIIRGFTDLYDAILAHRSGVLGPENPLAGMAQMPVRYIHRATASYYTILAQATTPRALQDGARWSIELDVLTRMYQEDAIDDPFWPIVAAERRALEQGDIPYFLVSSDRNDLVLDNGATITGAFQATCVSAASQRIARLDSRDRQRQTGYIRLSLQTRLARTDRHHTESPENPAGSLGEDAVAPDSDDLIAAARAIGDQVMNDAIGDAEHGLTWMTVRYHAPSQRYVIDEAGPGVYDGATGIGLFLAALADVTQVDRYRQAAIASFQTLRTMVREDIDLAGTYGIGGASGIGAFVYGLVTASRLLHVPALGVDAGRIARRVTVAHVQADTLFDLIGGSAGCVLGMLALHQTTGDGHALAIARACGDHLLEHRTMSVHGHAAWASPNGTPLAGCAHGAAGIAYALLRLAEATGDTRYRGAAEEAIAFEAALYSPDHGNWPDLRGGPPGGSHLEYAASWCNGGTGIGLARLGGLDILDSPSLRADINAASRVAASPGGNPLDHLCCGHLGRVDVLVEMASRLRQEEYQRLADRKLADIWRRSDGGKRFRLSWESGDGVAVSGLYQGVSGIGYALLRAARPATLPSLLLMG